MVGDSGVGKTSIVYRFTQGTALSNAESTIGASLTKKLVTIGYGSNAKIADLNIWDTAGQEKFQCLIPLYLRNANSAIIVADVTKSTEDDIYNLQKYYETVTQDALADIVIVLAINKIDLDYNEERKSKIEEWASGNDIPFFSVSAMTGVGITEMFEDISTKLLENCQPMFDPNLVLSKESEQNNGCC